MIVALLAFGGVHSALAQDMPPILAPPAPAPAVTVPVPAAPAAVAAVPPPAVAAQRIAPPAPHRIAAGVPPVPPKKPRIVAARASHVPPVRHVAAALPEPRKRAVAARPHPAPPVRVAVRPALPSLPPGTVLPPPGYWDPGPRERLVYGGPPPALYQPWGGYRGGSPYSR